MSALRKRIRLPARGWVELRASSGALRALSPADAADALGGAVATVHDDRTRERVDPQTLSLADANVLRAALAQLGATREEAADVVCENCDAAFTVTPCAALELAPYFDGELDDELDAPFPFDEDHETPPILVGGREARTVRLRDVTLGEVAALHRALALYQLRITKDVVAAMGIVALGEETDPRRIARALQRADDEALDVVLDLFDEAHYPPRLTAEARCPKCGAKNAVEAPVREFPAERGRRAGRDAPLEGFPDAAAFEAIVEREAAAVYARLGVRNVDLIVEGGTPDCDDGGVPLLGSYTPPEDEGSGFVRRPPEVRVYYRTFRSMFEEEPYDVRGEIEETIEHELTHHLAFLSGHDPEDEEERAEIARETRRAAGDTETIRRATKAARGELADFVHRTWPIWVVALAVTIAATLASR